MLARLRNISFAVLALGAFIGAGSLATSTSAEANGFRSGGGQRFNVGIGFRAPHAGFGIRVGGPRHGWNGHHNPRHGWGGHGFRRHGYIAVRPVSPDCYYAQRVNRWGRLVTVPICS